ncbi:Wzz/FepE/Etk N-terminal domain-containing protein [Sphaerotilus sp.]|jgi:uncharacterized protein involved in exopolysaccharide biosynthesis|uniref:Wzz/FepE/Etk N-terminal domain-containing protein n=1 Tax=Sphaerotilus sp. TaxID=2093942 RepID=UPI0025CEADE6|nr:Wzz/FepE/Etk N-terminal domain-containing protein [Sphaerotilus sp.]
MDADPLPVWYWGGGVEDVEELTTLMKNPAQRSDAFDDADEGAGLVELAGMVGAQWARVLLASVVCGALGFGGAMLIPPTFTARSLIMPPQQQQNIAAAALGSLGALAGLAGGISVKNTGDQYVALLQSTTVSDRVIERFKLKDVYDESYMVDARKELLKNVLIQIGKKDGLISIEVDDHSPQRAAEMANYYIEELRGLTNTLAVSEAQQRRVFFENKLKEAKIKLAEAQISLQASGFGAGVLMAEPRAAAEGYAKLKAEATAADIKLQTLRRVLADGAQEVVVQQAQLTALRAELTRLEQKEPARGDADYINRYRDYKYQETLYDLYAKQYELARADESREGALIQVVDVAAPPEKKSKPRRGLIALAAAVVAGLAMASRAVVQGLRRKNAQLA